MFPTRSSSSSARRWLNWQERQPRRGPSEAAVEPSAVPGKFRARFAAVTGPVNLAERFDDVAAKLYFEAEDPRLTGDQEQSVRKLRQRRREMSGTPLVTAYDEQDPRFGPWTMSVLTYEDYADYLLANDSYVHLNNPPITIPPRTLDLHLCLGVKTPGAEHASTLQGVAALMLDDWRSALREVRVRFHLHWLGPSPQSLALGRGSRRWRDRGRQRIPPDRVVAALFGRANRAHALDPFAIAAAPERRHSASQWWCACLLEDDLPALGFARGADRPNALTPPSWTATHAFLPRGIEHVFVVPPEEGPGAIYRVDARPGSTALEPMRQRHGAMDSKWWHSLRVHALDVVLEELLARMR